MIPHFPSPITWIRKIRGGVTGVNITREIIVNVASVIALDSSAYHMVGRQFIGSFGQEESNYIPPVSSYFKIGELMNMGHNGVVRIAGSNRFPADNGVSVKVQTVRVLWDLFGFMSPIFQCSPHAASGSIKHLATSKTINVSQVTILYECLRTVIKHFE